MTATAHPAAGAAAQGTSQALDVIRLLAEEIGPRRPCSPAERHAGEALVRWLERHGVQARLEEHRGYATFAAPYGLLFGAALAGGLLQRRNPRLGTGVAAAAAGLAALEGDLRVTPVSDLLSRAPTANPLRRSRRPVPRAAASASSGTWTRLAMA